MTPQISTQQLEAIIKVLETQRAAQAEKVAALDILAENSGHIVDALFALSPSLPIELAVPPEGDRLIVTDTEGVETRRSIIGEAFFHLLEGSRQLGKIELDGMDANLAAYKQQRTGILLPQLGRVPRRQG